MLLITSQEYLGKSPHSWQISALKTNFDTLGKSRQSNNLSLVYPPSISSHLAPSQIPTIIFRLMNAFDFTLSPSNKRLPHGRHPADRCDNFLIFCMWEQGGGSQMSVSIIYSGAILREGGGAKKFPQKSFGAAKVQIPLRLSNMQQVSNCAEI